MSVCSWEIVSPLLTTIFFSYTRDCMSLFITVLYTLSLACAVAYPLRPPSSCQCQHFPAHSVSMYVLRFVPRYLILYLAELKATLCLNACRLPSNLYCSSYLCPYHYWPLCSHWDLYLLAAALFHLVWDKLVLEPVSAEQHWDCPYWMTFSCISRQLWDQSVAHFLIHTNANFSKLARVAIKCFPKIHHT